MNIWLIHHGGTYNRGCEAIVRTTVALVREALPQAQITLWSGAARMDRPRLSDLGIRIASERRRFSTWKVPLQFCKRLPPPAGTRLSQIWFNRVPGSPDAVLSIGGDNYTLECGGHTPGFLSMDMPFVRTRIPFIIWAASIGPFDTQPETEAAMVRFLSQADLITVREPLTLQYLHRVLPSPTNTRAVCDPAFLLEAVPCRGAAADFVNQHRPVGLNASVLSSRVAGTCPADLCQTLGAFVHRLVDDGRHVLLVPHVYGEGCLPLHDDRDYLARIQEAAHVAPDRVFLVREELGAASLKGLIGRCSSFVGARTHATIASLSSAVPTLSLSYSVKSRGINRDIFGHERFVMPLAGASVDSLYACWHDLHMSSEEVGITLANAQGRLRARARHNADALRNLLVQGQEIPS